MKKTALFLCIILILSIFSVLNFLSTILLTNLNLAASFPYLLNAVNVLYCVKSLNEGRREGREKGRREKVSPPCRDGQLSVIISKGAKKAPH